MGTNTTSFKTTYHVDSAQVDISDEEDGDAEIEVETDASRLQNLIDREELELSRSKETDDRMLSLTCAAVAVDVDDGMLV